MTMRPVSGQARELVTALIRVGSAGPPGTPAGALAMADADAALADSGVTARVERLLRPSPGISLPARVLSAARPLRSSWSRPRCW